MFPKYEMIINGKKKYLSLQDAGIVYDNGFVQVEIGDNVLESDFTVRNITKKEEREIANIADEYSANK